MTKNGKTTYVVFLSHASSDAWLSKVIAQQMRKLSIEVWLDEMSLTGGDLVFKSIREALKKCNEALVIVSDTSIKSQWVAAEIGMAMALKKRITPLLNNVADGAMAPLHGFKSYELNKFENYLRELKTRKQHR